MMRTYVGFCDPSGGSSDSMTLAIAHFSILKHAVLDGVWERKPPFSPDAVVQEFAAILKSYGITTVVGDRYAGEWPRERFRVHGITYQPSENTKSEIFTEFVALLNSGHVRIHGNKRLRVQLQTLERRSSRTGKDIVDHPAGSHDDIANSVAGAVILAAGKQSAPVPWAECLIGQGSSPAVSRYRNLAPNDPGPAHWWTKVNY